MLLRAARVQAAGQRVRRAVGDLQRLRRDRAPCITASTGPKISSWARRAVGRHVGEDVRGDVVALVGSERADVAGVGQPASLLALLDGAEDALRGPRRR